jgi:hypothetical protein
MRRGADSVALQDEVWLAGLGDNSQESSSVRLVTVQNITEDEVRVRYANTNGDDRTLTMDRFKSSFRVYQVRTIPSSSHSLSLCLPSTNKSSFRALN